MIYLNCAKGELSFLLLPRAAAQVRSVRRSRTPACGQKSGRIRNPQTQSTRDRSPLHLRCRKSNIPFLHPPYGYSDWCRLDFRRSLPPPLSPATRGGRGCGARAELGRMEEVQPKINRKPIGIKITWLPHKLTISMIV
jgi:hypothetical protein